MTDASLVLACFLVQSAQRLAPSEVRGGSCEWYHTGRGTLLPDNATQDREVIPFTDAYAQSLLSLQALRAKLSEEKRAVAGRLAAVAGRVREAEGRHTRREAALYKKARAALLAAEEDTYVKQQLLKYL